MHSPLKTLSATPSSPIPHFHLRTLRLALTRIGVYAIVLTIAGIIILFKAYPDDDLKWATRRTWTGIRLLVLRRHS